MATKLLFPHVIADRRVTCVDGFTFHLSSETARHPQLETRINFLPVSRLSSPIQQGFFVTAYVNHYFLLHLRLRSIAPTHYDRDLIERLFYFDYAAFLSFGVSVRITGVRRAAL